MSRKYAILLAGGTGSRMGAGINKVLLPVAGIPCIVRSAMALSPWVDRMILVCRPEEQNAFREVLESARLSVPVFYAAGGATRQLSVTHGLREIARLESSFGEDDMIPEEVRLEKAEEPSPSAAPDALVLIHDGARCLVSDEVIRNVLESVQRHGSGVAAIPVTDTLREVGAENAFGRTIPREGLQAMQTPQGFRLPVLLSAFAAAEKEGFEGTDDAAVVAHAGFPVHRTPGSRFNLKLTTREDLRMAEAFLKEKAFPELRVGQGYDVHQLAENRRLVLCGVEIPYERGLLGHSDADVAVHALMDALLGAACLGDIGRHFPDSDEKYHNADSMKLLEEVLNLLRREGYRPANADVTIVAQKPKLAPYILRMTENLASALMLPLNRVNVKATTTERLGFEGRMEGISAQAVCLIQSAAPASVSSAEGDS